jgi:hypothetical protein
LIQAKEAEKLLAALHGIKQDGETAFAAKIGNLKRLGAVPASRRGKRLAYEIEDLWALDFCLGLEQFQIPPATIAFIMRAWWRMPDGRGICQTYKKAAKKDDLYIAFKADFLTTPPSDSDRIEEQPMRWFQAWPKDKLEGAIRTGKLQVWLGDFVGLIAVSWRVGKINAAIAKKAEE